MEDLKVKIESLKQQCLNELNKATTEQDLESIRLKYLSRSGEIALLMSALKDLKPEEKRVFGPLLNELKKSCEEAFESKKKDLQESKLKQEEQKRLNFDVTAYKPNQLHGSLHPYTYVIEKIENVCISMGFEIVEGPELEDDFHNFSALNIPEDHPAREMQDTFWLNLPGKLMRTHTSSVQIRTMEHRKPPFAIIAQGRTYRNEATDASHDFVFMQTEGLMIGKDISMSNLFAIIKVFLQSLFDSKELDIRIRPSYFPFVEPGVEVDMRCPFCTNGCSTCKKTRWIEILGAGLVHPNVLKATGIDPTIYTGFAFGTGLTRLVMLKYGINDIRLLNSGKIEFLEQF